MGRFYGEVGYVHENVETSPGIWEEQILEKNYSGDVVRNSRRLQSGESLNDNIVITNEFSILADPYAYQNFHAIRYIKWMGSYWKVERIDVQRPRLILSVGGVYNGNKAPAPDVD